MIISDRGRKFIQIAVGVFFFASAIARMFPQEFRAPIAFWRGPIAINFAPKKPQGIALTTWAGIYIKTADKAYKKHGSSTATLTRLFLGEQSFTLADVLGDICECPIAPDQELLCEPIFLNVEYAERGIMKGVEIDWRFAKSWYAGLRVMVPYRETRVIPIGCPDPRLREVDTCCLEPKQKPAVTPAMIIASRGICLERPQRNDGLGDVDSLGWYANDWLNVEGRFFLRRPVAESTRDARLVFRVQPGNNDHFEVGPGLMGTAKLNSNVFVRAQAWYSFALGAHEKRAAAFSGTRVKNIGVPVNAHNSWSYFLGDIDLTVRHPNNHDVALTIGYELYAKGRDNVTFKTKCAKDLCCNLRELDATVLKKRTDVIAHRVRSEYVMGVGEALFTFGTSYVFAGRNCPRELDVYVGALINF